MSLREEKKELTRRALAREALRRFLDKGYEQTTLDEIASAVRVSLPSGQAPARPPLDFERSKFGLLLP